MGLGAQPALTSRSMYQPSRTISWPCVTAPGPGIIVCVFDDVPRGVAEEFLALAGIVGFDVDDERAAGWFGFERRLAVMPRSRHRTALFVEPIAGVLARLGVELQDLMLVTLVDGHARMAEDFPLDARALAFDVLRGGGGERAAGGEARGDLEVGRFGGRCECRTRRGENAPRASKSKSGRRIVASPAGAYRAAGILAHETLCGTRYLGTGTVLPSQEALDEARSKHVRPRRAILV